MMMWFLSFLVSPLRGLASSTAMFGQAKRQEIDVTTHSSCTKHFSLHSVAIGNVMHFCLCFFHFFLCFFYFLNRMTDENVILHPHSFFSFSLSDFRACKETG